MDATGGRGALDPVLAVLAYLGLAISLARWRSPPHLLSALTVLAGFSAVVLTTAFGGHMRRSLVAVPFVYALAGVVASEIVLAGRRFLGDSGLRLSVVGIAGALAFVIAWNSWYYFGNFVRQDHTNWVFVGDFVDSLKTVHHFNDPGTTYFYSGRWSYDYEPRRFLFPDSLGIDRSKEFGEFTLAYFQADRYWPNFARAVGIADLNEDPRFVDTAASGALSPDETILLVNTGSGMKHLELL